MVSVKPNIVFIECDSMDGRVMGCMGHPAMARATPNLDALAQRGVLFSQTYCNNPICCPSRASMWSGQYTHHCEGWNNFKGLEPDTPTFRDALDRAGYRTQCFGKTDYLSGRHTIRARVTPWTRSANVMRPAYRMAGPLVLEKDVARVHKGDWLTIDRGIDWLEERTAQHDGPFWLYLGLNAPHPRFVTSQRYLDAIDLSGVDVPLPDEQDHPVMRYQRMNKNWMHGLDDQAVRRVRHIYFAMIAEVDAMVGQVISALDDLGLTDSTWIIFTSDHGELAMEHGQFYKMSAYEPSVRVPLIVSAPDVNSGFEIDSLVSLIDVYPTLMDIAGLSHPAGLDGYSLWPELTGSASRRPDWVLSEFHGTSCNTGTFMLRRGNWKYVAYAGYQPQLFNLAADPGEVDNLTAARSEVAGKMDDLLRSIVDYEQVDARVKAYDRRSFAQWRQEKLAEGTYAELMARIYSGWDDLPDDQVQPWTSRDEALIEAWLADA
jgi:arylsulfatase K